jgi:hypothetical protein
MKRTVLVFLLGALACAPAAAAKGPHAILTTPREAAEPGKPWEFTMELYAFADSPQPAIIGRRGARTVGAEVEKVHSAMADAAAFRFTMVFPSRGSWKLLMFAGDRRFAFPAVRVGGARTQPDYITAFPISRGQTPISDRSQKEGSDPSDVDSGGDGGIGPWLLPLLGVMAAGLGVAAIRRRGWRLAPRPPTGAARPPRRG